jgi:hypothetical protein
MSDITDKTDELFMRRREATTTSATRPMLRSFPAMRIGPTTFSGAT